MEQRIHNHFTSTVPENNVLWKVVLLSCIIVISTGIQLNQIEATVDFTHSQVENFQYDHVLRVVIHPKMLV